MPRKTGTYETWKAGGETIEAFIPLPLPPKNPPLVIDVPFLYLSLGFKRHRQEYYRALDAVRTNGDWEAWIDFYLDCAIESADDGTDTAKRLFKLVNEDRRKFADSKHANLAAMRLFERLPEQPMITA